MPLLLSGLATVLGSMAGLGRVDLVFYDAVPSLRARPAPEGIVSVAIDAESVAALGRWTNERRPRTARLHHAMTMSLTARGEISGLYRLVGIGAARAQPAGAIADESDDALRKRIEELEAERRELQVRLLHRSQGESASAPRRELTGAPGRPRGFPSRKSRYRLRQIEPRATSGIPVPRALWAPVRRRFAAGSRTAYPICAEGTRVSSPDW